MKRINPSVFLFPEYANLEKDTTKVLYENPVCEDVPESEDIKQLKSVVYAINPVTGHPSSDIATMMSKDTNPEVAAFIKDRLLQSHDSTGTLDADEALATVKTQNMSAEQYQNQILQFIDRKQKSDK